MTISTAATVAQTTEWRAERRTRLFQSCIDILVKQINDLTGRDIHIRYADKLVLYSRVFMDFLSMEGDEVSTATMCPTKQCTSCWCPRDQLHDPDQVFPFRDTQSIRAELETTYAMHMLRLYNTYTDNLFCQGHDSGPGLDIMLLKQQHFSVSGQAAYPARQHPPVEYVYHSSHPLLQFLPEKLAE
jgi:hypothetical protein